MDATSNEVTVPASGRISPLELSLICLTAILLRALLAVVTMHQMHVTLERMASFGDGSSYVAEAKKILGQPTEFSDYDRRVFPGYPLAIAGVSCCGLPVWFAALAVSWGCTGLAAVFSALLCRDRRVGWGMVFLIPHYLLYTTMAMNESLLLTLCTAGLFLAFRFRQHVVGGILLGLAGFVRPNACFAAMGFIVLASVQRRWRDAGLFAVSAVIVVGTAFAAVGHFTGDPLQSFHSYSNSPGAYQGGVFTWPFHSLIVTPIRAHAPLSKTAYIGLHVLILLPTCLWAIYQSIRSRSHGTNLLMAPWLLGNTAFILCIGNIWGFEAFHRFVSWALPPLLWSLRPVLPRRWGWIAVAAVSFALASYGISHNSN